MGVEESEREEGKITSSFLVKIHWEALVHSQARRQNKRRHVVGTKPQGQGEGGGHREARKQFLIVHQAILQLRKPRGGVLGCETSGGGLQWSLATMNPWNR